MDRLSDRVHTSVNEFKRGLSHELQLLFGSFVILVILILGSALASLIFDVKIDWFGHGAMQKVVKQELNTGHSPGYEKVRDIEAQGKVPQFVVFSFDGSKSLGMWRETMDFAKSMREQGAPLAFTYFINAVYFLHGDDRYQYQAPGYSKGASNIGFAESSEDIKTRVKMVNAALRDGHEIASHTAGHFDGSYWNREEWTTEFNSFTDILSGTDKRILAEENNHRNVLNSAAAIVVAMMGIDNQNVSNSNNSDTLLLDLKTIKGFRAPLLGISPGMYETLRDKGYNYDSSKILRSALWPSKDNKGIWQFPLNTVYLGGDTNRSVLGMDYSMFVAQTNAQETLVRGTPEWQAAYNDVVKAWRGYFESSYNSEDGKVGTGTRAPISIADHFSKWNDGVYWEAYKTIAREICGKPDVYCGTYRDLVMYLETKSHVLEKLQQGNAANAIESIFGDVGLSESNENSVYREEFANDGIVRDE